MTIVCPLCNVLQGVNEQIYGDPEGVLKGWLVDHGCDFPEALRLAKLEIERLKEFEFMYNDLCK